MRPCFPNEERAASCTAQPTVADFSAQPEQTRATVLLISPLAEDHEFFSSIFEHPYWKAYRAYGYREASKWLMRDRMTVIICDSHLPDGDWKDILSQVQVLPEPPYVVVASGLASDCLWAEVLNLGGYDVLAKPFIREEVVRVAGLAWMNWKRDVDSRASAPRKPPNQEVETPVAHARAAQASGEL
jgi:DNA-binding response OmpR family regulator